MLEPSFKAANVYDYIASRMTELGEPSRTIEQLLDDAEQFGFFDCWDMDRHGFANAMTARGFVVKSGSVYLPTHEGEAFNPVATGHRIFLDAVERVFKTADAPIDTLELIERCALSQASMPLGRLRATMLRAGYFHITGCGYWTSPQYTSPDGKIITARLKSQRLNALFELFERDGWPICSRDIEEMTGGVLLPRFMTLYASKRHAKIISLGAGLFAPVDQAAERPFPITNNLVKAIFELGPTDVLTDKSDIRLFRIGLLLQRHRMAEVKISRSSIGGQRIQTMRIVLTPKGQRVLKAKTLLNQDAF